VAPLCIGAKSLNKTPEIRVQHSAANLGYGYSHSFSTQFDSNDDENHWIEIRTLVSALSITLYSPALRLQPPFHFMHAEVGRDKGLKSDIYSLHST
jgi:hypothetical protein